MHITLRILQIVAGIGIFSSSGYYLLCISSAAKFLGDKRSDKSQRSAAALPPVSILKPLKGMDPEIESVKALQQEFPDRRIQLVICLEILGANVKVSNLTQMLPAARFDSLIVNDSDIRVTPDYLRTVMAPLSDSRTGMVTCLYRGVAATTLGSRLESLGISTDFCPGVLVARQLEGGIRFGLGSTLAFRRAELEKLGGFRSIVDHLADDYELGKRIASLGLQVELSSVVVETHLPAYRFRDFFAHQLRWARGVRDARAGGYLGLVFTFGIPWALVALVASQGSPWSWATLASTLVLHLAVALLVGVSVLGDRQVLRDAWLIPLRDLIAAIVWFVSLTGDTVTWRGERFRLRDGKLTRIVT